MRWIGDVLHLQALDVSDVERAAADLRMQPEVAWAQPNYIRRRFSTPNDPGFSQQWNMPSINMPLAWDINAGAAEGILVAVLDSGLTTVDGTFTFRIWTGTQFQTLPVPFAKAADFDHGKVRVGADFQVFGGWSTSGGTPLIFDAGGHGTHVAGTVAQQTNNSSGFAGVAFGVELLPVKVCFEPWDVQLAAGFLGIPGFAPDDANGCDDAAITEGIRYAADQGAKVINLSLGGEDNDPAILNAMQYAVSRGAFIAIAGGNAALDGNPVEYPAGFAPQVNGAVSVGAVTPSLARALYSNTGSHIELSAPGGAGPFGAPSEAVFQMAPNQSDLSILRPAPAFNRYQEWGISGTSMAAPHVAAVAALLYSQGVRTPAAIEAVLKKSARDLGNPGKDDEFGAGLVDARAAIRGLGLMK
jgi:serine protease